MDKELEHEFMKAFGFGERQGPTPLLASQVMAGKLTPILRMAGIQTSNWPPVHDYHSSPLVLFASIGYNDLQPDVQGAPQALFPQGGSSDG